ncbi:unnamed protein product [Aphanomyces euteiches]
MERLLFDALDTIPLEEALELNVDVMEMDDFDVFDPSVSSHAAKVLSAPESPQTVDTTSSDGAQSPSDHEKPTSLVESAPRKQVNTSRKRQREEIEYLRSKVEELEQHLKILKEVRGLDIGNESTWQETANRMRVAKQNALHENERLKHELEEYIQFGKALQAVMKKRPKLTVLPTLESDQWRVFKLVKDQTLRHRAMNEIPQLMYQLTEAAMVESGLNDKVDNFESYTPRLTKTSSDLVLSVSFCSTKHFDFNIVSEMAWKLFCGGYGTKDTKFNVLEKVDCNTTYVQYMKRWNAAPSQANVLYKRIMEPTRDVIVCRTVLEDELNPFPEGVLVMNKSTWVVLEKLDNGKACRMKFFQKSTLPMIQSSPDTQSHLDSDAWFEYYRVGTVSDSVMHSLKTMVTEFNGAITALLSNYNGNIDETFKKVIAMMDQES